MLLQEGLWHYVDTPVGSDHTTDSATSFVDDATAGATTTATAMQAGATNPLTT